MQVPYKQKGAPSLVRQADLDPFLIMQIHVA